MEKSTRKNQFTTVLEVDKMKKSTHYLWLLVILPSTLAVFSQQPPLPFLRNVLVTSSVSLDRVSGIYTYRYTIENGLISAGRIISFEIDISRDSSGALLDSSGLQFRNARLEATYRQAVAGLGDQVIPVSFPSLPMYCDAGVTFRRTIDFFRPLIDAGQRVSGYVVNSRGVPGIRGFIASPRFEVNDYYPRVDEVSNPDSLADEIDRDREAVKYRGLTVGPTAPPANFVTLTFLDTLLSYTRQSAQLGWLGRDRDDDCDDDERPDDGVVRNIENRLQKARRELVRGDSVKARKELVKLVRKVDRLQRRGERIMTSEAYALLKYNTEYLIERLPERRRR